MKTDAEFLKMARDAAKNSPDRSTKVGCIIVTQKGFTLPGWNTFPCGIEDREERHERPAKYQWIEHAERNAIYDAAADGIALHGSAMYLTGEPCVECARAIINSGIRVVAIGSHTFDERWAESLALARSMLVEAGVVVRDIVEVTP